MRPGTEERDGRAGLDLHVKITTSTVKQNVKQRQKKKKWLWLKFWGVTIGKMLGRKRMKEETSPTKSSKEKEN